MHCVFLSPGHLVPSGHDQGFNESCGPNSGLAILLGGGLGVTQQKMFHMWFFLAVEAWP